MLATLTMTDRIDNSAFIKWLEDAMDANDITYVELAKSIGSSPSTFSMWRTNKREPSRETIAKVASVLHVDPKEGIRRVYEPESASEIERISSDDRRILAYYKGAPPHRRQVIDEILGITEDDAIGDEPPVRELD